MVWWRNESLECHSLQKQSLTHPQWHFDWIVAEYAQDQVNTENTVFDQKPAKTLSFKIKKRRNKVIFFLFPIQGMFVSKKFEDGEDDDTNAQHLLRLSAVPCILTGLS